MKKPARFQLRCILGQDTAHLHDSLLDRDDSIVLPRPLTLENFKPLVLQILHTLEVTGLAQPEDNVVAVLFNPSGNQHGSSYPE